MITKYTSVQEVIGRVIDDVGGKLPNQYYDSMLEWIPQGIRILETKYQLIEKSTGNCGVDDDGNVFPTAICTNNHVAVLPSDMISLIAVEDENGERVRLASSQVDFTNQTDRYSTGRDGAFDARPTNFQVDVWDHTGTEPSVPWDGSDLKLVGGSGLNLTYKIQGNMIQTSMESVFIKLHYLSMPTDQDGFLLVPDVEEYKQALGFYLLRQLVGAGFKHPIFNGPPGWNHYNSHFELWMGRAFGAVKYPTIDRMEKLRTGFAERLIPAHHAYADFFVGNEQTQEINGI
jgi:hypothetical protein